MYKNAKLWTDHVGELVEAVNGCFRAKQTVYFLREQKNKVTPYIERGAHLLSEELEDLTSAYNSGRLYFKIA